MDELLQQNGSAMLQQNGFSILLNEIIPIPVQNIITRLTRYLALNKIQ